MIYFCSGAPRSGSTLLFKLTKVTLENMGFDQRTAAIATKLGHEFNFLGKLHKQRISEIDIANQIRALKTHVPPTEYVEELLKKNKAIVNISVRDPRDILLSLLRIAKINRKKGVKPFSNIVDFNKALVVLTRRCNQTLLWANLPNSIVCKYEQTMIDLESTIDKISLPLLEFEIAKNHVINTGEILSGVNGERTNLIVGKAGEYKKQLSKQLQQQVLEKCRPYYEMFYPDSKVETKLSMFSFFSR